MTTDGIKATVITEASTRRKRMMLFWLCENQSVKPFSLSRSHLRAGMAVRTSAAPKSAVAI